MQPTNNPRPVMDVTAPHRPPADQTVSRPPTPLPVREAPAAPEDGPSSASQQLADTPASTLDNSVPADPKDSTALASDPTPAPSSPADEKITAPTGAIAGAVLSMLVLAGIAVLVYLKS